MQRFKKAYEFVKGQNHVCIEPAGDYLFLINQNGKHYSISKVLNDVNIQFKKVLPSCLNINCLNQNDIQNLKLNTSEWASNWYSLYQKLLSKTIRANIVIDTETVLKKLEKYKKHFKNSYLVLDFSKGYTRIKELNHIKKGFTVELNIMIRANNPFNRQWDSDFFIAVDTDIFYNALKRHSKIKNKREVELIAFFNCDYIEIRTADNDLNLFFDFIKV